MPWSFLTIFDNKLFVGVTAKVGTKNLIFSSDVSVEDKKKEKVR